MEADLGICDDEAELVWKVSTWKILKISLKMGVPRSLVAQNWVPLLDLSLEVIS